MAQTVSAEFGKEEGLSSNLRVCIKSDVGTMIVPNTFFFSRRGALPPALLNSTPKTNVMKRCPSMCMFQPVPT